MNTETFHKTYYDYLSEKAEDVVKVVATDSNNEKWFQGEMAICFSSLPNYKIISSEEYNDDNVKKIGVWWENNIKNRFGIITTEAKIYMENNKKSEKCDFILQTNEDFLATELKVIWIYKDMDIYDIEKRFKNNKVYEDAKRLKFRLENEYRDYKNCHIFLTLVCIGDEPLEDRINDWYEDHMGKKCKQKIMNKVRIPENEYKRSCWERIDGDGYIYLDNIYLLTLDLEHNFESK